MDLDTLSSRGFIIDGQPLTPMTSYDAASQGRRLKGWAPGSAGPTRAVVSQLSTVRARSRDAARNNGWIANAIGNWVSNEVGAGIKPRSKSPDKAFAEAANKLWDEFTAEADYDGVLDVYGLMALAVRGRKEAGEMFVRIRHLELGSGTAVPVQFQLIESEQVPHTHHEQRPDTEIIAGVEFNKNTGKRTQYWMYRRHPSDMAQSSMELIPVPAAEVIHHFAPLRAGQVRGARRGEKQHMLRDFFGRRESTQGALGEKRCFGDVDGGAGAFRFGLHHAFPACRARGTGIQGIDGDAVRAEFFG